MPKAEETVLEIDLRALEHNYNYLRSKLRAKTKFLGVVKAFAYGSEAEQVAKKLETLGADYLAVAYVDEGIALRRAGVQIPILVLHPLPISFDKMVTHCLEPSIYSLKIFHEFLETARQKGQKNYPVHLKFNTGLNRLGFGENDIKLLLEQLQKSDEVKVASLFSHLGASEDRNEREFTLGQIDRFEKIAQKMMEQLPYLPIRHLLNTSGIINYPESQYDMVRSGIGLYGFGNEAEVDAKLIPVATLKTVISQIHEIEPGGSVGYNRGFVTDRLLKTATLPIGHADGLGRQYGNGKTYVSINGNRAKIIGNVCMDMIMVDVTDITCAEGDEVIIFGTEPTADSMAKCANTISYELLTAISQRIKRNVIG